MVVTALPDFLGAMVARLRSFSELTTLCGTTPPRISGELQDAWFPDKTVAQHAIWIEQQGMTEQHDIDHFFTRIDLHCFGSTGYEARRLWRQVHPILCPTRYSGTATGFQQSGVRVWDIAHESGPFPLLYPQTDWRMATAAYRVRHSAVAVPA